MMIAIGKVVRLLGVSATTLRRWDANGTLPATYRTRGGHRRYRLAEILAWSTREQQVAEAPSQDSKMRPQAITYARVSAAKQKADLQRQTEHLREYVEAQGWTLVKQYQDIGSGLNDKRKGLLALIRDIVALQPDYLVCRFSDRLARFGIEIIRTLCKIYDTQIVITQEQDEAASINDQLVKDVIALITSFAGKLYRRRRGRYQVTSPPEQVSERKHRAL